MRMRILAATAAAAMAATGALVTAGSAAAAPPPSPPHDQSHQSPQRVQPDQRLGRPQALSSHVKLYGLVSCARRATPPQPWTGYLASRVRFREANGTTQNASLFWLSYSVDLNNVPRQGENVTVSVTCRNSRAQPWTRTIHVDRQRDQRQKVDLLVH